MSLQTGPSPIEGNGIQRSRMLGTVVARNQEMDNNTSTTAHQQRHIITFFSSINPHTKRQSQATQVGSRPHSLIRATID